MNGGKGKLLGLEDIMTEGRNWKNVLRRKGYLELKFQKWNNPEIQVMFMEVD